METFVIYYNIDSLTAPTRMRSKSFDDYGRAKRYYEACRRDWQSKAQREYEANARNKNYRPNFDELFKETERPEPYVISRFAGEVGWTRYSFSLEVIN